MIFFNELFRVDKDHIIQSLILSIESLIFNFLILIGSGNADPTTIACVLSSYFVFVPIAEYIIYKKIPSFNTIAGVIIALVGVFFIMDLNVKNLLNINVLLLVLADIAIVINIMTISKYTKESNPSILAMGQLFFNFLVAGVCWMMEVFIRDTVFYIPKEPSFWGSVIFISFFIRGMYSVVQIYAQRYVTPLNTSLIFSTEIIMTMIASPFISLFFSLPSEDSGISVLHICGAMIMVFGMLFTDDSFLDKIFPKSDKHKEDINV